MKTQTLKVYLAGKISGNANYKSEFIRAELAVKKVIRQCDVINPIRQKPLWGIRKWFFWMIPAIKNVWQADLIVFLPTWKRSKGAIIEYLFAKLFLKETLELIQP